MKNLKLQLVNQQWVRCVDFILSSYCKFYNFMKVVLVKSKIFLHQLLEGLMEVLSCEYVNDLHHSLFHLLNCLITTPSELSKSHREQGLDYREAEELSWCPSCSNSLWQGWSCRLVHCPGGNATDPISRVLASSLEISSWTPLKP